MLPDVLEIRGRNEVVGEEFTTDILRTMSEMERIAYNGKVGGNTHTYECFDELTRDEIAVDRAVFFTDEQGYGKDTGNDGSAEVPHRSSRQPVCLLVRHRSLPELHSSRRVTDELL